MFGGLELKGSAPPKKTSNDDAVTKTSTAAPPSDTSSAFGFLNSFTSTTPAEPAAPSAFSFLNSGLSTTTGDVGDTTSSVAATPAPSAFSFLSTTAEQDLSNNAVHESTAPATTSSFNFIQTVPSMTESTTIPDPPSEPEIALPSTSTSLSAFSFLSSPSTTSSIPQVAQRNISATSSISAETSTTFDENPMPAGSGVTFGSSGSALAPASKGVKKKRTRTAIVGALAHQQQHPVSIEAPPLPAATTASSSHTMSVGSVSIQSASAPPRSSSPKDDSVTRESALEAARRAEEFMLEKTKQLSTIENHNNNDQSSQIPLSFKSLSAISSVDSDDDPDGIFAAARAAAEEAHKLESKNKSTSILGLFRSRPSPPTSSHNSIHSSSPLPTQSARKSVTKSTSEDPVIVQPSRTSSVDVKTSDDEKADSAERLRKEQEEILQRAHASRQALTRETQQPTAIPESYEHKSNPITVIPVPLPPSHSKQAVKPPAVAVAPDILSIQSPPTPRDKFNAMIDRFHKKVVKAMNEITQLRQHRTGLLEEQHVTAAKERLAGQQKSAAEAQQMAAAEAEEFELADEMSIVIDKYAREKVEYAAILENIKLALQQVEAQKQACIDHVRLFFHEIQDELLNFQKQTESEDTKDVVEKLEKFSEVSKVLSIENERLQQDWKRLERDASLIAEERKEVESAISLQAGEFEKARDNARKKLKAVEDEIDELRKLLAAKQTEAARLRTEVAGHDESVLKVRVKFSRQLNRVQKKEMEIQDTQREWEMEKANFDLQREAHELQMSAHSEALLQRDQLLEKLSKEIAVACKFESIIVSKDISFFDGYQPQDDDNEDDSVNLAQLQADVVKAEAAKNDSQLVLKAANKVLVNLEAERKRLEVTIPELEEMKKAAAIRRDFKTAGYASKEIKESTARLKQIKEDLLEDAKEKVSTAESELSTREAILQSALEVANEKEKQSGLEAMHNIADNIKQLLVTKDNVCGSGNGNKQSNQSNSEKDSEKYTIQNIAAFVLDAQINALQAEGQSYGHKFGKWDELMQEITGVKIDCTSKSDQNVAGDANSTEDVPISADENIGESETKDQQQSSAATAENLESLTFEEKMDKFLELTKRLKEVEDQLEIAVAEEDFETADALDGTLQQLVNDLNDLNMTDSEVEIALSRTEAISIAEPFDDNNDTVVDEPIVQLADEAAQVDDLKEQVENVEKGPEESDDPEPEPKPNGGSVDNPSSDSTEIDTNGETNETVE